MRDVAVVIVLFAHAACAASPQYEPPPSGDCVEIGVQSTGFHTSLVLPRSATAEDHPLRLLYPDARWYVIGWGDEDFFREPGGGTWTQGVRAAFAGGPTALHVIALDAEPELYFRADSTVRAAVTGAGAERLAEYVAAEIMRDAEGGARVIAEGGHGERSRFLRGRDDAFHLFNNCNHWTARGLRRAGLPIAGALTAPAVTDQVRRLGSRCEADPP